ncbi:MAG: DUF898 family protein [Tissierella sp.]|uniref:DUF898 family protein n=1 Tax=Tissierella sp. TaxID=41274 RepID=UPI003F98D40D
MDDNFDVNRETAKIKKGGSYFDGGLFQLIAWSILGFLITLFTLGICYPWALCMVYGWRINHTVIEGNRLKFTGSAVGLFGHWIKWLLLTIITFGIYGFWVRISLEKWKVKNTRFQY